MSFKILSPALILFCALSAIAQTIETKNPAEDKAKLEKEAVVFLRETLGDVGGMRSLENRISFTAELAGLMWFHDEREAKAMFTEVANDFRQLLLQYDAQMNSFGLNPEGEDGKYRGGLFGGDMSERGRVTRKFATAMAVRQQIAMSMAEHDADLAYSFYYDSLAAITNAEFRKQLDNGNTYFESQLIAQIAETNPAKAVQYGAKTLDKGLSYQHIDLLRKIYEKDADKGAEFASVLLSRAKSEKPNAESFYVFNSFLNFAGESLEKSRKQGGKRAVLSQSDVRDLAEVFAQAILNRDSEDGSEGIQYAGEIEKYSPSRAAQIRAKFKSDARSYRAVANAVNAAAYQANTAANAAYASSTSGSNASTNTARAEREDAEKQVFEDVMKIGSKQLPKEERDKVIAEARRIISQTPGRDQKVTAISMLAAQVAQAGDKELAAAIMTDAASLVNPSPKNYQDFLLTWMLASGYAAADPDKAFPLLDDTIGRANETIAAFVKAGEFFDVAEEMIQDGEVQVGAFGGGMVRGLTGELGMADSTIQLLAKADFTKTKNLTNRFDRPEVRVLAKMMVIRAILGPRQKANPKGDVLSDLSAGTNLDEK